MKLFEFIMKINSMFLYKKIKYLIKTNFYLAHF